MVSRALGRENLIRSCDNTVIGLDLCASETQPRERGGYVKVEEVDLRFTPEGCTSHPIIKLSQIVPSLALRGVGIVRVHFREDDIPLAAMKLFLSKYGYSVEEVVRLDDNTLTAIARRRPSARDSLGAVVPRG